MTEYGPKLAFSEELHRTKYRGEGENFKMAMTRVASALTDEDKEFRKVRDMLLNMRFLPAGRIQTAIGSVKRVTPYNCFVSGDLEDSFVEGQRSIMNIATQAATTMRMGGGIGYDFSPLRPSGDIIRKLQSHSSGPVSFMQIFDAICRCTSSSGHRRGAQMGVMRITHPDIEQFIHVKKPPEQAQVLMELLSGCTQGTPQWTRYYATLQCLYQLTGFNTSVAVTDKFMKCLRDDKAFPLEFGGRVYKEVEPAALWNTLMRSTWDYAEPGVLFIDTINKMNNLWYCESIAATNPCGEQPLPPYGACLLGSFNLVKYIVPNFSGTDDFDWELFEQDIVLTVRIMDRVIDVASYPLFEQEKEAKAKRRMGLGVTALANALEYMEMPYGGPDFIAFESRILDFLNRIAYRSSCILAKEKGCFPMLDREKFLESQFVQTLDEDTQAMIKKFGIRNSHLTSIAPTGTISMCADNVSSAIEPVFSLVQERDVYMGTGMVTTQFPDYGYEFLGVKGRTCDRVTIKQHLDVLVCASLRVDSAVSKTCNVPATTEWGEFKDLYRQAWERGCKGLTTYQVGGKRQGIIKSVNQDDSAACKVDAVTGRKECE